MLCNARGERNINIHTILNLEVPLPKRRRQFRNQIAGFFTGLASTLIFFVAFRDSGVPFPYLVLILWTTFLGAVIVHELGHLLVGWSVGFHFNSI